MTNVTTLAGIAGTKHNSIVMIVNKIRDMVPGMPGYTQKPDDLSFWYNLWTGHTVQLESFTTVAGTTCVCWSDGSGWVLVVPIKPGDVITVPELVACSAWGMSGEMVEEWRIGAGTVLVCDPDKTLKTIDQYPPDQERHKLDPMVAQIHSITNTAGTLVRYPSIDLTAALGTRVTGVYTLYSNGALRYGHTGPVVANSLGNTHRSESGIRLAVVEITLRNKSDSLDGMPSGVSVRVLEQHATYTTGPVVNITL